MSDYAHVGGYTRVGVEKGHETYNAGFSIYSAAWPLLHQYPGQCFQSGLFGTWMHMRNEREAPIKLYSTIEGGLGWWRDTRFATETPKFIMGGVALNFVAWANGPGAGKGRSWAEPNGKYGIAQLSPWVVWPPDGLNLKQGTCGELFGYGYLPLPLTSSKSSSAGKDVPTGNQCWTLFLNSASFKGPVAFFMPYFWSRASVDDPRLSGMFMDTRPGEHNRPVSMETQHIPWAQATDSNGQAFARMARTKYPVGPDGDSTLLHRVTSYSKTSLWDAVEAWMDGGDPVDGAIDPKGAHVHPFNGDGGAGWRVFMRDVPKDKRPELATDSFMRPVLFDPTTFGFRWEDSVVTKTEGVPEVTLPEYYRLEQVDEKSPGRWIPVSAVDVPAETGLVEVNYPPANADIKEAYVTPDDPESCWKKPGPVAGPFEARPGDGSVVTYYWYRFADQPAILNADLTDDEREELQKRAEKLHRHWTKDREYLAPPTVGELAHIDPALIVTPPKGLEAGYVPIATRQGVDE